MIVCAFLNSMCTPGEKNFKGKIISAETNLPLAAAVSITNGNGLIVEPDGDHEHVYYLNKKYWYVDGEFSLSTGRIV